jgi:hypothetical protein
MKAQYGIENRVHLHCERPAPDFTSRVRTEIMDVLTRAGSGALNETYTIACPNKIPASEACRTITYDLEMRPLGSAAT